MTDIHNHILYGVDDGSPSLGVSLEMAELALASGVKTVVATPHFRCRADSAKAECEKYAAAYAELCKALKKSQIPLRLLPGAEVLCFDETPLLASKGLIPTLANSRDILVEFFFDESADFIDTSLGRLYSYGFIPVIAHPERYEAVWNNPELVLRWFRSGYVIQVNKGSVLGRFGRRAERRSHNMLDAGLVHIIATDAHGSSERTPDMTELCGLIIDRYGEDCLRLVTSENPGRLVRDLPMVPA